MSGTVDDAASLTAQGVGTGVLAATCVSAFIVNANTSAVTILLPAINRGARMTPVEAGPATLPAALGIVLVTPFVSGLATRIGSRAVVVLGFVISTGGFASLTFARAGWGYAAFALPLVVVAVGMGLSSPDALASGVGQAALLMTVASALGIAIALFYGRHRPVPARPVDRAAAAAGVVHTMPAPAPAPAPVPAP